MITRICLIAWFSFAPILLWAQQESTASLRNKFHTATNDTIVLNAAKQLFARYVYTQADSAVFFASKIVEIGEDRNDRAEVLTGNTYLGVAFAIKGDYEKAGEYMQMNLKLYTEAGDSLNMAYSLNNLGVNYTYAGDYLQAAENLISSARIKEGLIRSGTSGQDVDLASTIMNIAIAYQSQLDTAQAASYFQAAIEEAGKVENTTVVARSKTGLANLFIEKEDYQNAVDLLLEAETILTALNDGFSLGKLYNNMAKAYAGLEDAGKTNFYATKSIEVNGEIGNAQSQALGRVYLGLAHILAGRHVLAIRQSNMALAYGEANEVNEIIWGALKNLSEAHAARGDYQQAYEYSVRYKDIDELIFADVRSEQIERMSAQYEAEKREIEIDNLNKETALQSLQLDQANSERNLLFVIVGSLVLILLIIAWFYRKLRSTNLQLDVLNRTKDRFFAIISHDLRGHISAFRGNGKLLKHLMAKKQEDKLEQVTNEIDKNAQNLGELLDNLLYWSQNQLQGYKPKFEHIDVVPVINELVEAYQPLAVAKGIALRSEIETIPKVQVDRNGLQVILRNLIANAIKFTDEGEVVISAFESKNELAISVKDNGMGIPRDLQAEIFEIKDSKIRRGTRNEKGTGLGLNLANEFAVANGGWIDLASEEGQGTTFDVYLPYG